MGQKARLPVFSPDRNWPDIMHHVSTKEHCRILWLILIETENDDLVSPARGIAETELTRLLGDDWREICLKEWPE